MDWRPAGKSRTGLHPLANALVAARIKIVGLDSPSPDKDPYTIHKILL